MRHAEKPLISFPLIAVMLSSARLFTNSASRGYTIALIDFNLFKSAISCFDARKLLLEQVSTGSCLPIRRALTKSPHRSALARTG